MPFGNLGTAIQAGNSGRQLAQNNASVIANNVSNVNTEGFTRKHLSSQSIVLAGVGSGVQAVELKRVTDMYKVEQVRNMTSVIHRLDTLNTYYQDFNRQLGQPGDNNALTASFNNFRKNVELLSQRPESDGARSSLMFAAQNLASDLARLSSLAQNARSAADQAIYGHVREANVLLNNLKNINAEMQYLSGQGFPTAELLDQRDENLKKLSELMDYRVQYASNDTVSIYSNSGVTLLQSNIHQITFSMTAGISPASSYAGGTINPILLDNNPANDLTASISGGKIGALLQARDVEFPAFQQSLDQFAGVLRDSVNAIHNMGTASNIPRSLNGTISGFTNASAIAGAGTVSIAIVDRATGNLVENTIIDLSTIGTVGNILGQINGTANATANLDSNGALNIQATNPNYGIAIGSTSSPAAAISSGVTQYGFSHYFGLNDFFVTGSTGKGVSPGISGNLRVNSNIENDITQIANGVLDITGLVGQPVIAQGDNTNLIALAQTLNQTANFAAAGKIPPLTMSLGDYAGMCIYYSAESGSNYEQLFQSETATYEQTLNSLDTIRGVNVQEEVMNLMMWQRQLKVCTQLILTAEDMLNTLISMKK